mmetsp:Transcript_6128/g.17242  ORF Transcript_6128/g.17242 Transcript_6128/m.17242 type:complete len:276 (-) Transcript_6128:1750-2577(-)
MTSEKTQPLLCSWAVIPWLWLLVGHLPFQAQGFSLIGATPKYLASLASPSSDCLDDGNTQNADKKGLSLPMKEEQWHAYNQQRDGDTRMMPSLDDYLWWIAQSGTENPEQQQELAQEENTSSEGQEHFASQNVVGTMLRPCQSRFCTYMATSPDLREYSLAVCCQASSDFLQSIHGECLRDCNVTVGDIGCVSIHHWRNAYRDGVAPPIFLEATHALVSEEIDLNILMEYALDQGIALDRVQKLQRERRNLKRVVTDENDDNWEVDCPSFTTGFD